MRELPTVSRDRLLDALCLVETEEQAAMLPDVARAAAESLAGVSLAFFVTGTARGIAPLRAAATRLPVGIDAIAVQCNPEGEPRGPNDRGTHRLRHRLPRGPPGDAREIGVGRVSPRSAAGARRFWPTAVSVVLVGAMLAAAMIPWWPVYESPAFLIAVGGGDHRRHGDRGGGGSVRAAGVDGRPPGVRRVSGARRAGRGAGARDRRRRADTRRPRRARRRLRRCRGSSS